jgi:hypothetical protein
MQEFILIDMLFLLFVEFKHQPINIQIGNNHFSFALWALNVHKTWTTIAQPIPH